MNFERDLHEDEPREREVTLGTATIIGLFLALALICGAFFGFGYSLGRHSSQAAAPTPAPTAKAEAVPEDTFKNFKAAPAGDDNESAPSPSASQPPPPKAVHEVAVKQPVVRPAVSDEASAEPSTRPVAAPLPAATSAGQFVVQVSATTRESDAQSLLAALKRKGYTAFVKQEADNRFHVQVGPFAAKADAETTRKQLDADGYKGPFIK